MNRRLTKCELEVMNVVWKRKQATVQDVCDNLDRPLAYTTVMTTLNILEKKRRAVKRTKHGRAYVYEPAVSREAICDDILDDVKQYVFSGSAASLMLGLLGRETMSSEDIHEIKSAIEKLEAAP